MISANHFHFHFFCLLQHLTTMNSYIHDYINGSDNLNVIQAISLWGSPDEKQRYLFVHNTYEMLSFVMKVGCDSYMKGNQRKISDKRISYYFERRIPFGNSTKITFANIEGISKHSC